MCGIVGIFNLDGQLINIKQLWKATLCLKHRGPDYQNIYVDRNIGLGHARLSIIDLSEKGNQPMANEDGSIYLVFNGEIYNFQELRKKLEEKGHKFYSKTDSEVILHGYEEWGEDLLYHLRGMFAFAIWDNKTRKLFLARDRVGKKPLYYFFDGRRFIFASEIKAILCFKIERRPDYKGIYYYLSFQYVPSPWTAFEKIKALQPAHYLLVKENGFIYQKRYWKLEDNYIELPKKNEEICERLREELKEAVKIRLVSDVPLGIFLSGGVDSSILVAIASKILNQPLRTFTIGFTEKDFDERRFAQMVAKRYNTEHKELIVKPNIIEILPKLVWHYNQPFADNSAIPSFYVCKMAKQYVKVILTGDGGDENFAGYHRYVKFNICVRLNNFFTSFALFKKITKFLSCIQSNNMYIKKLISLISQDPWEQYVKWMTCFLDEKKSLIESPMISCFSEAADLIDRWTKVYGKKCTPEKALLVDIYTYLPDDLLVKMDIASMAYSIEARSPFLDHKFMEFCYSIPFFMKLAGWKNKRILKKAFEQFLPKQILYRRKQGFIIPLANWFRNELKEFTYDILLSEKARSRGLFKMKEVENLLNRHMNGYENNAREIYIILMLELWFQMWIDKNLTLSDFTQTHENTSK